jgi:hypothetical protein
MGWDAYAVYDDPLLVPRGSDVLAFDRSSDHIELKPIPAFESRANALKARGLVVDWLLKGGGLDVSCCGEALKRATGIDVYGPMVSAAEVRDAAARAIWSFPWPPEKEWARESARAFLEAAAECGFGIRFS